MIANKHFCIRFAGWMAFVLFFSMLRAVGDDRSDEVAYNDCGPACLFVALASLDKDVGDYFGFLKRVGEPSDKGYSLLQLEKAANAFGIPAQSMESKNNSVDDLTRLTEQGLFIAHLKKGHFQLLLSTKNGKVHAIDPPSEVKMSYASFCDEWSGNGLLIPVHKSRSWSILPFIIGASVFVAFAVFAMSVRKYRYK